MVLYSRKTQYGAERVYTNAAYSTHNLILLMTSVKKEGITGAFFRDNI